MNDRFWPEGSVLALPRELVPEWKSRPRASGQSALGRWATNSQTYIAEHQLEPYEERHILHQLVTPIPYVSWGFLALDDIIESWTYVARADGGLLLGRNLGWAPVEGDDDVDPFAEMNTEELDWYDLQSYVDLDDGELVLLGIDKDDASIDWEADVADGRILICPVGHGRYEIFTATYRSGNADNIVVRLRRKPELVAARSEWEALAVPESPYLCFEVATRAAAPWERLAEQLARALNCVFYCVRGDGSFADGARARAMGCDLALSALDKAGEVRLSARPSVEAATWTQEVDISVTMAALLADKGVPDWRAIGASRGTSS